MRPAGAVAARNLKNVAVPKIENPPKSAGFLKSALRQAI